MQLVHHTLVGYKWSEREKERGEREEREKERGERGEREEREELEWVQVFYTVKSTKEFEWMSKVIRLIEKSANTVKKCPYSFYLFY